MTIEPKMIDNCCKNNPEFADALNTLLVGNFVFDDIRQVEAFVVDNTYLNKLYSKAMKEVILEKIEKFKNGETSKNTIPIKSIMKTTLRRLSEVISDDAMVKANLSTIIIERIAEKCNVQREFEEKFIETIKESVSGL